MNSKLGKLLIFPTSIHIFNNIISTHSLLPSRIACTSRSLTLLNDSIRIAETAYSVCLLETQISVLIQAQKIAKVRTFLMMLIV
jgi:hypothetical protein